MRREKPPRDGGQAIAEFPDVSRSLRAAFHANSGTRDSLNKRLGCDVLVRIGEMLGGRRMKQLSFLDAEYGGMPVFCDFFDLHGYFQ